MSNNLIPNLNFNELRNEYKRNERDLLRLQNRQKQLREFFKMAGTIVGVTTDKVAVKRGPAASSDAEARVLTLMEHGKTVSPTTIARRIHSVTSPSSVQIRAAANTLRRICNKGLIDRVAHGKYRIIPTKETAKIGDDTRVTRVNPTATEEGQSNG